MFIFDNRHHDLRVPVYASTYFSGSKSDYKEALRKVEGHDKNKNEIVIHGKPINYSWLKGASETYQISPDIKDYVLSEVPIVTVDYPNRNLHCFPYDEVTYFDPRFGQFVYKTFVGKCAFADHNNKVHTEAKGTIFDATMKKVPGWNTWKINILIGYDRTKDAALAKSIEKGQRRSYSMGAWVSYFINSITGQISNGSQSMKYPKGSVHDGRLSFDQCSGVEFFETSSVEGPADVSAESHQLWYF